MRSGAAGDCMRRRAAALEYWRMGWALIPLAPRGKAPCSPLLPVDPSTGRPTWRPLAQAPASKKQIAEWFDRVPEINVGVILGSPSGGLVVGDFDCGMPAGWHIPPTPRAISGRCEHVYLRGSNQAVANRVLWHGGKRIGEVKVGNAYVVAPPSVHPTGRPYRWAELLSPADLDWTFADPPAWCLDQATDPTGPNVGAQGKPVKDILYSLTLGVSGEELGAWCGCDEFVLAATPLLGIEADKTTGDGLGRAFRCILPGHDERSASASLFRRRDGLVVYRDWHRRDGEEFYYLAEVYASRFYGYARKLASPELTVWQLRLLVDTGLAAPAPVAMPDLPTGSTDAMHRVYSGFRHLLGCKWLHTPGEPTAFTWRFASAWCGVSERHAGAAMGELIRAGIILPAGHFTTARGKPITVFLPGRHTAGQMEVRDNGE